MPRRKAAASRPQSKALRAGVGLGMGESGMGRVTKICARRRRLWRFGKFARKEPRTSKAEAALRFWPGRDAHFTSPAAHSVHCGPASPDGAAFSSCRAATLPHIVIGGWGRDDEGIYWAEGCSGGCRAERRPALCGGGVPAAGRRSETVATIPPGGPTLPRIVIGGWGRDDERIWRAEGHRPGGAERRPAFCSGGVPAAGRRSKTVATIPPAAHTSPYRYRRLGAGR